MGLDMYARAIPGFTPDKPVDFDPPERGEEFHYWRKHPNLHGWMEQLYRAKGGTAKDFNCAYVQLTADDLNALETAVLAHDLPHTEGFFFGASSNDAQETSDDLDFVAKARKLIADGQTVFYTSWW